MAGFPVALRRPAWLRLQITTDETCMPMMEADASPASADPGHAAKLRQNKRNIRLPVVDRPNREAIFAPLPLWRNW